MRSRLLGCIETVSYLHMHTLVALHGQPGWVAVLCVDGSLASSLTPLLPVPRTMLASGVPNCSCPLAQG